MSTTEALTWCAALIQELVSMDVVKETDWLKIDEARRTVADILDAADEALADAQ